MALTKPVKYRDGHPFRFYLTGHIRKVMGNPERESQGERVAFFDYLTAEGNKKLMDVIKQEPKQGILHKKINKWYVNAILIGLVAVVAVALSQYHIVTGTDKSFVFVKRPYSGFSDMFADIKECTNVPYIVALAKHQSLCNALQTAGYSVDPAQKSRDIQRLDEIRELVSSLALYSVIFNKDRYPESLNDLVPSVRNGIPSAPVPADGKCTEAQNTYTYKFISDTDFTLTFCLGGQTEGYPGGLHIMSSAGIN